MQCDSCGTTGCKISLLQKNTAQTGWLHVHSFPQQEDVKEDTSHGMDVPHKFMANWKMLRFQYHEDMRNLWKSLGLSVWHLSSALNELESKHIHPFKKWTRYNSCTWHLSETFCSVSELLMDRMCSRICLELLRSEMRLTGHWLTQKGKSMPLSSVRQQEQKMDKAGHSSELWEKSQGPVEKI